jgi:hypothetical protein
MDYLEIMAAAEAEQKKDGDHKLRLDPATYKEFGFDVESLQNGNIPTAEDFRDKITGAHKKLSKDKKTFNPEKFKKTVVDLYRDLRGFYSTGRPKDDIRKKLSVKEQELAAEKKLLESKEKLLTELSSAEPARAISILEEGLTRPRVEVLNHEDLWKEKRKDAAAVDQKSWDELSDEERKKRRKTWSELTEEERAKRLEDLHLSPEEKKKFLDPEVHYPKGPEIHLPGDLGPLKKEKIPAHTPEEQARREKELKKLSPELFKKHPELLKELEPDTIEQYVGKRKAPKDESKPEFERSEKQRWDVHMVGRSRLFKKMKDSIKVLSDPKTDKNSDVYKKALSTTKKVLQEDIQGVKNKISVIQETVHKLENRLKTVGLRPIKEKIITPVHISPLGDMEDLVVIMETMKQPPPRVVEVDRPHHFGWLFQPKFLVELFNQLNLPKPAKPGAKKDTLGKEPVEQEHTQKSDIGEEVQPLILETVLRLFHLTSDTINRLTGPKNIFDQLNLKDYAFSTVDEGLFKKYAEFLKQVKGQLPADEYKKLINFDTDNSVFYHKDLPGHLTEHRKKLEQLYDHLMRVISLNTRIFENKWNPIIKELEIIQDSYRKMKKDFNVISKEEYWQKWLKGKSELLKEAFEDNYYDEIEAADAELSEFIPYLSAEKGYNKFLKSLTELKEFLKKEGHLETKNVKEFALKLKEAGPHGLEWIDKLGPLIDHTLSSIIEYKHDVENFTEKLLKGNIFKEKTTAPTTTEEKKLGNSMWPVIYNLKRLSYILQAFKESPVEWRSEYPLTIPLQQLFGKMKDFFQKSYPAEEFLNDWFTVSGSKTLATSKLQESLKKDLDPKVQKEIAKSYGKEKLQAERDKFDDELGEGNEEQKKLMRAIEDLDKWAEKSFDKYDGAISEAKGITEAQKAALKKLIEERKHLQENFEHAPKEHLTSERIKTYLKRLNEIHTGLVKLMGQLDTAKNPFTDKVEPIGHLESKASRVWNIYNDNITRNLNRIKDLQDKSRRLENAILQRDEWMDEGVPEDILEEAREMYLAYTWRIFDTDWARKPKQIQSRFNINYDDYLDIKEAFEKLAGHTLPSTSMNRMVEEIKKDIKYLKEQGQEVPKGHYEFLKRLKGGPSKPETKEPVTAQVLLDFPNQMALNVLTRSSNAQVPDSETEMIFS